MRFLPHSLLDTPASVLNNTNVKMKYYKPFYAYLFCVIETVLSIVIRFVRRACFGAVKCETYRIILVSRELTATSWLPWQTSCKLAWSQRNVSSKYENTIRSLFRLLREYDCSVYLVIRIRDGMKLFSPRLYQTRTMSCGEERCILVCMHFYFFGKQLFNKYSYVTVFRVE